MAALYSVVRDSPFGQLVRLVTKNRFFKYRDELSGFEIPWQRALREEKEAATIASTPASSPLQDVEKRLTSDNAPVSQPHHESQDLESLRQMATIGDTPTIGRASHTLTRESSQSWTKERLEAEQLEEAERAQSAIIVPVRTTDGITLITWYSTTDEENPQTDLQGAKPWSQPSSFFTHSWHIPPLLSILLPPGNYGTV